MKHDAAGTMFHIEDQVLLFLFMSVFPQTFFTFMGRHLVPFSLFSARHSLLFISLLLYVVFNFVYKCFGRFECRNMMSRNNNCCILRDIPTCFLSSAFDNKTSKPPQINIFPVFHRIFYSFHKSLNSVLNGNFFNPSFV